MKRIKHGPGVPTLAIVLFSAASFSLPATAQQTPDDEADTNAATEVERRQAEPERTAIDTSQWRCRLCPFETGWRGSVTGGVGYVSEDSFEFGDYSGLEAQGAYVIGDGELHYRGEQAEYWDITAEDLGLESRSIRTEGGRQGRYRLYLEYDELPHFTAEDARTVFSGVGSPVLTLPDDWVAGQTTGEMTELDDSLQKVDIEQERKTLSLGVGILQEDHWQYDVNFRHSTREGNRLQGGNFLLSSSQLVVPVDYVTDEIDASVAYVERRWQLKATYYASFFSNREDSVTWDNPFTALQPGGDRGRMALPPDNRFNQVLLSGAWRSQGRTSLSGRVAYGRMEQNDAFLPATLNPTLTAPALPRDDLDGRVDTLAGNLRLSASPLARLTTQVHLYYDERDNKTPRDEYVQVPSDLFIGGAETNRPYSFEKRGGKLNLDYRLMRRTTVSTGASREAFERTFQEIDETDTDSFWGEVYTRPFERVDFRLRQTREVRDHDGTYEQLDLVPPENPNLRKFHLADRDRDKTTLAVSYMPRPTLSLGFTADYISDDYEESEIGLTDAKDVSFTLDISMTPAEKVTTYAFLSQQRIESEISGSDTADEPNWFAQYEDTIWSAGIGFKMDDLWTEGLDAGIDFTYTRAIGETDVDKREAAPGFPDLENRLHSVKLFGDYAVSERTSIRLNYWYERYRADDFFNDDVEPDTISNVLMLGDEDPDYDVHVIGVALKHRF